MICEHRRTQLTSHLWTKKCSFYEPYRLCHTLTLKSLRNLINCGQTTWMFTNKFLPYKYCKQDNLWLTLRGNAYSYGGGGGVSFRLVGPSNWQGRGGPSCLPVPVYHGIGYPLWTDGNITFPCTTHAVGNDSIQCSMFEALFLRISNQTLQVSTCRSLHSI